MIFVASSMFGILMELNVIQIEASSKQENQCPPGHSTHISELQEYHNENQHVSAQPTGSIY